MKKLSLLLVPIFGIVLMNNLEAAGRISQCPKGMVRIPTDTASGYACGYRTIKPVGPPPPPIVIQSFEPASAFPGDTITIHGSGFGGGVIQSIHFSSADPARMEVVSATELKVTLPLSAEPGPVRINSYPEKRVSSVTSAQPYPVRTDIVITRVEPSQGKPGTPVKIYVRNTHKAIGEYYDRGHCQIRIGGIEESDFYPMSSNLDLPVQRTIPAGAKHGEIAIDCGRGKSTKSNLFQLIAEKPVEKAPEIKITSIYPAGGIEKNNEISIFGTQLQNAKEVTFNGKKGSIRTSSSGQIRVIVPNMDGAVKIVAVTPQGSTSWDNYNIFKSPPLPEWKPPVQPVAEKPKVIAPPPSKVPDLSKLKNPIGLPDKLAGNNGSGITNTNPLKDKGDTLPGGNALKDKMTTLPGGNALKDKGDTLPGGNALATNSRTARRTQSVPGREITPQPAMCPPGQSMTGRGCVREQTGGSRPVTTGRPEIKPQPIIKGPIMDELQSVPIITKAPATANPEENIAIHGKNFIRINGKSEMSNFKEVFWVKGNSETKAQGVSAVGNPGEEDRINLKTPKEAGNYSIKVVTAKGTALWNKPLVSVVGKEPSIPVITAVDKTKVEPEEIVTIYGKNLVIRENGKFKEYNFRQLSLVQGKIDKAMVYNVGKGRGDEDSVFFMVPKDVTGTYVIKLYVKPDVNVRWENPPITIAKKAPPIPVISSLSKTKAEVGESLTLYGKNLIAQDASGFTSMNFDKMFFVKDGAESRVTAITGGSKKGDDQSINFSAPKETGSYSIKIVAKTGEVVTWNNPLVAVADTAAEKKKAEEELALKKKAEEELAKKKALDEEIAKKKAAEELAKKQEALRQAQDAEERQKTLEQAMRQRQAEEEAQRQREIEQQDQQAPPPAEPEVATHEPEPQEEAGPQCEGGTWSPTLQRCVYEEAPQEEERPDCPAGTHWSPTLQSCQAD